MIETELLDPVERVPPAALSAERNLLSAIIIDPDSAHEIIPILRPEDFFRSAHQSLYRAIVNLYDSGKAIDPVGLEDILKQSGEWEAFGGAGYMIDVLRSAPHSLYALSHAQLVRDKAIRRRLIRAGAEIVDEGYRSDRPTADVVEAAERRVFAISESTVVGDTHRMDAVTPDLMDRVATRQASGGGVSGLGSGWPDLDALTAGFQPDQLVIVAARPSMGKTAFALNLCEAIAGTQGVPTLFVSLEMGRVELAERLLCGLSKADNRKVKGIDRLTSRDSAGLDDAAGALEAMPLFIDETAVRTVLQIHANARRIKQREGLGMVVVDYIQLLDSEREGRDSRQEQIAKMSRKLKAMARDLHVPVVALSQLNRGVEQREDRRPRMSDLRESGAIEQDADTVILLHRPEYYDPMDSPGVAEVIVAKNRNGATGTAKLAWVGPTMRFESLDWRDRCMIPDACGEPF